MDLDNEPELYDFKSGDELSDLKLIVEDHVLHVHKAILATSSPVFKRMLTLNFRENLESEIKLPGKKLDNVLDLLKMIYPNYPKNIDDSNIESLLELSEEYCMTNIKNCIEKNIIKNLKENSSCKLYGKAIENQIEYLTNLINVSLRFRLNKLKNECIDYLSINFSKKQLDVFLSDLNHESVKLCVYGKKLDLLEEKLKSKELKIKHIQDENLKQKFEIKRLELLTH